MSVPAEQTATKTTTMSALKPASTQDQPPVAMGFDTLQAFEALQRVGKMFAQSTIVPQQFQNNVGNCVIAVELALRLRASPLMVMQNLYVVYGRPAWSAKFLIATFNQCGRFTSIDYLFQGTPGKDDWGCRAYTTELATGEKRVGPLITVKLAKDEGWWNKNGSKWPTMTEQMLRYRAAAWFINTTAPEISMGLPTDDEVRDTYDATKGADGTYTVTTESLRQASSGATGSSAFDPEAWISTLRSQTTLAGLEETWKACKAAFGDFPVPLPFEDAYQTTREAILEREGKQLEL